MKVRLQSQTKLILATMLTAIIAAQIWAARPCLAQAESAQKRDEAARLEIDVKTAMDRSTLTDAQKAQFRDDLRELRRAHQNHETFASLRAARSIRTVLDSGAFKPEDSKRIKEDLQAIREARESEPGGRM